MGFREAGSFQFSFESTAKQSTKDSYIGKDIEGLYKSNIWQVVMQPFNLIYIKGI